jgi:serine/threonine protein kinase
LGEGHFGKVYQGTMNILGKTIDVAWKVSNSKENASVFLNEIKLWSRPDIRHPNIVKMLTHLYLEDEGTLCSVFLVSKPN